MPASRISSAVKPDTAIGTSCTFSARLRATTTTSSSAVSASAAPDAAMGMAMAAASTFRFTVRFIAFLNA
jgi:hypothetical protein